MDTLKNFVTYGDEFAVEAVKTESSGEEVLLVFQAGELLEGFTANKILGLLEDMELDLFNNATSEDANPTDEEQGRIDALRCAAAIINFYAKQRKSKN